MYIWIEFKIITMISLSDHHKKEFEERIQKISAKDEEKVRKNSLKEIEKLRTINQSKSMIKLEDLVREATLLHDILHCSTFPLSESSKKWIVFGLGYLVSDFDIIPDAVPSIGYVDDALVISWVVYMLSDVIERYYAHLKNIEYAEKGEIVKSLLIGDGDTEIIILPGLLYDHLEADSYKKWVNFGRSLPIANGNPGISIADISIQHLKELNKTLKIVDHDLVLKPIYDSELFTIEWQQALYDFELLGSALKTDIENRKLENPNKEIILIGFDVSSVMIEKSIEFLNTGNVSRCHIFGGCTRRDAINIETIKKINKLYNYFSDRDFMLKFLYDNYEYSHKPIGLAPINKLQGNNIVNLDVSNFIQNHHEYRSRITEIIIQ